MRGKSTIVTLLAGVNILLALCLIAQVVTPAAVRAQTKSAGRAGDFICVTAKAAGQGFDVLYTLDLPTRKLHAFFPPAAKPRTMVHVQPRDLKADFDRK